MFSGYHMPVRIDFRIAEDRRDPIFKSLRDKMFKPFCFFMHFIPCPSRHPHPTTFRL
jgi:hypothetical protein